MGASRVVKLAEVLRKEPLKRKLLLCGGYAEGHQLVERVVRARGPVLNLEVKTLRGLVSDRVQMALDRRGLTAVSASDTYWLTYGLLRETAASQPGFLALEQLTPGVVRVFHRAVQELREAGVEARQLLEGHFENNIKGRFLRTLLEGYEKLLQDRKLADYTTLVQLLPVWEAGSAGSTGILIACEEVLSTWADRLAFDRLGGGDGVALTAGLPFTDPASGFPVGSCRMFHANGVLAEAREVFRRMLEQGIPWDQAEIVLSDYSGGIMAVHGTAVQLGMTCTYGEGLPVRCSRVGKAALYLLDWIESDYRTEHLVTAFRGGDLGLWEEEVSSSAAARALEASGIGWGRGRYALLAQPEEWACGDEAMTRAAESLSVFVETCFKELPEHGVGTPGVLLKALCVMLESYAGGTSLPEEQVVLAQLQELHRSSGYWGTETMSLGSSIRFVREQVESLSCQAVGIPGEGAIWVSSLTGGGMSGRPYTFVIGMNEPDWRVSPKQDPVLLDEERARISPELVGSASKVELVHKRRLERLGEVRGSCVLSYSAYDLAERREVYPAYELLQVFRLQTGQAEADFEELREHLGGLMGYTPSYGRSSLDEADAWMKHLVTAEGQIREGRSFLHRSYDHLNKGAQALEARQACADVTEYDGMVDTSVHGMEFRSDGTGKAFSASRLELYARCPMQFYYQEVLRLRVKEVPEFDRTRWLDAMQRGSLLHAVFEKYYAPWAAGSGEAEVSHDREFLTRITEEVLEEYTRKVPAPSPHVREKEAAAIRRDVDLFYRQEVSRSTSRPVFLELQLHSEEEPFRLELSEELVVPLRGYVDRVDLVGPHQYRIVDYKTGKPAKYKEQEYFAGGTQLQHALYALAVEQWLRRSGADSQAEVVEAAYYFPTEKGLGEEMVRLQNRKEELAELMGSLLASMESGVFPPTREPNLCGYCNYFEVCGKQAVWMKDKGGERLKRLQEVYSHA